MPNQTNHNSSPNGEQPLVRFERIIMQICDILRRGNCAGAMQYVPELTWILFLRILDDKESLEEEQMLAVGGSFAPTLEEPYRWRDWGAPGYQHLTNGDAISNKRQECQNKPANAFFEFMNSDLLPHLRNLRNMPNVTFRQKVVSEIVSSVERVRVDSEKKFLDILDLVHQISIRVLDVEQGFALSQVYERLLLKMGERGNDGGQFFTPRPVIKAMVEVIDPTIGETVHDPCCGTGGFLVQSYEHVYTKHKSSLSATDLEVLRTRTFSGREKENLVYPITLANMVLHGIDRPSIWHGNTLTGTEQYGGLFEHQEPFYDIILTNPPFGGREGVEAQVAFEFPHRATQLLFLQHVLKSLRNGGRCGIVLDEGLLFRKDDAYVKTKRKLVNECSIQAIVSLPSGVFTKVGAGVKTNLVFFSKGQKTKTIWYYDLSNVKVTKRKPLELSHFQQFFELLPTKGASERSWTVDIEARRSQAEGQIRPIRAEIGQLRNRAANESRVTRKRELERKIKVAEKQVNNIVGSVYDLRAINPGQNADVELQPPIDIITSIEQRGIELQTLIGDLRKSLSDSTG